jgi:protein SCO1
MMADILGPMRHLGRSVAAAILLVSCARPSLVGTDLGATDAPDFTLTDGITGAAVQLSSHRGNVVALTFLYTSCPDVCPLTASRFKATQDELGTDAAKVTFVAVSVDPDRDTPQAVQTFSGSRGLTRNWYYLVGGRSQLAPVWAAYGIGSQAASSGAVTHNDAIYLIDRRGRERVLLHSEDLAATLTSDVRALLREGD